MRADYIIRDAGQLEAIAEPTRQRIVTLLEELGESSIPDLARRMERSPESLYHHARRLERAGLLVQVGSAPSGRRHKAVYRLPGRRLRVDPENRTRAYVRALQRAARGVFRLAERLAEDALGDPAGALVGPEANHRIQQLTARLDRAGLARLRGMLEELDRFLLESRSTAGGRVYTVTYAVSPSAVEGAWREGAAGV